MIERYLQSKKMNLKLPSIDFIGRRKVIDIWNEEHSDVDPITYEQIFK